MSMIRTKEEPDTHIADLQKIPDILRQRGYSGNDIQAIASGNLIAFLQSVL